MKLPTWRLPFFGKPADAQKAYPVAKVDYSVELIPSQQKALPPVLSPPGAGGWTMIFDTYPGQWQQDVATASTDDILAVPAVFACMRLIATDIGKLRMKLVTLHESGVWVETTNPAFSPVLRKPNHYQTRIKFFEQWVLSKMTWGNAYVLKGRDRRGVVNALYVLDPSCCQPLISDSGAVYYRLHKDTLAQVPIDVIVPAREIIHDVHMVYEHPLVGVSPIVAAAISATQASKIQRSSSKFFANMSRPSFVLSAPGHIADDTAARIKTQWEANFGGDNYGRTAVLGDGLKPESFTISAEDSQLIEQLEWTGKDAARAFGVPAYKIGIGPMPTYNNIESLQQQYYSEALQELMECIELLLDEGLELSAPLGTEFDLDGLIRMDSLTQAQVNREELGAGYLTPNEARRRRSLLPVEGGDTPYMQQQNYALAALARRDAKEDPFAPSQPALPPPDDDEPPDDEETESDDETRALEEFLKQRLDAVVQREIGEAA